MGVAVADCCFGPNGRNGTVCYRQEITNRFGIVQSRALITLLQLVTFLRGEPTSSISGFHLLRHMHRPSSSASVIHP